jgi:hypothetical protein
MENNYQQISTTNWRKIISEILLKLALEFKDQDNFQLVKTNVLDPTIDYIFDRLYPYILASSIIFLIIFALLCAIFYMILRSL